MRHGQQHLHAFSCTGQLHAVLLQWDIGKLCFNIYRRLVTETQIPARSHHLHQECQPVQDWSVLAGWPLQHVPLLEELAAWTLAPQSLQYPMTGHNYVEVC